jgi:hypothetical protein
MSIITKITFKDEGEIQGEPIGPVILSLKTRKVPCGWFRMSEAERLAARYGLTLECS